MPSTRVVSDVARRETDVRSPRTAPPASPTASDSPRVRLRAAEVLGPSAVVFLLFIGLFKGAPFLAGVPVDLTVMCMGLVGVATASHLLRTHGRARVSLWALAGLALALPAALYPGSNPAVFEKRIKLLIPLLAVVGVCYLVRSRRQQQVWVWLHVAVGVTLVATGVRVYDDATTRFTGAGSNTIGAGRASGVAILILLILLMTGGLSRWWMRLAALAVAGWLAIALISTGSRGPVFSCLATILLVATSALGRHRYVRLVTAAGSIAAGWLLIVEATGLGASRIATTLTGRSELTHGRTDLWIEGVRGIAQHPLGIGWGNFWAVLSPAERLDSGYIQYPHNFVLEIFLEAGWLAGVAAIIFVAASLIRLQRASHAPYGAALFGIAIFFVLNACVSGDINDNRMMWAALAIAWVSVPQSPSPVEISHYPRGSGPMRHQRRDGRQRLRTDFNRS